MPCQTGATDSNYTQAKSVQWNVDIQRVIAANLTVDVAYVGTHGYQEQSIQDINQPVIGTGWDTQRRQRLPGKQRNLLQQMLA